MERRDGCRRGKQIQEGQLPGVLGRVEARSSGVGAAGGWLWACPSREFPGRDGGESSPPEESTALAGGWLESGRSPFWPGSRTGNSCMF